MRGVPRLLFAICCLTGPLAPGQGRAEPAEHPDVPVSMLGLTRAMLGIRKGLDAGDTAAVSSRAAELRQAAAAMDDLQPQTNQELAPLFDAYRASVARLTAELAEVAAAGDLPAAAQVVGEVRRTCVSCHVRFRRKVDDNGLFPNIGNLIAGQVRLVREDGEERQDRSNVVVFLDRVDSGPDRPLPRRNPQISQKDQSFTPRVLPVVKGTTVDFPNDDIIFHNIFSLSKARPFDLGIYRPGENRSVAFPAPGWVKVYCNIHPAMIAHILVLDNPCFSLTDALGLFVIPNVPDGEYTLRTWHEFGGEVRREIDIAGASLARYTLEIHEDRKFVRHRNKFGKPYKDKY